MWSVSTRKGQWGGSCRQHHGHPSLFDVQRINSSIRRRKQQTRTHRGRHRHGRARPISGLPTSPHRNSGTPKARLGRRRLEGPGAGANCPFCQFSRRAEAGLVWAKRSNGRSVRPRQNKKPIFLHPSGCVIHPLQRHSAPTSCRCPPELAALGDGREQNEGKGEAPGPACVQKTQSGANWLVCPIPRCDGEAMKAAAAGLDRQPRAGEWNGTGLFAPKSRKPFGIGCVREPCTFHPCLLKLRHRLPASQAPTCAFFDFRPQGDGSRDPVRVLDM